jgi:4-amino-4-deoxy-L-arabinose transferase-like glycosyltransferase
VVTGSDRGVLALWAAAAVLTCYALAREVLGTRRGALIAALLRLLSPIFPIQSATFLP